MRLRVALFVAATVACVVIAIAAMADGAEDPTAPQAQPMPTSGRPPAALLASDGGDRPVVVMRDLARSAYGRLAVARAGDPPDLRRTSRLVCDRVYYAGDRGVCLRRGGGLLNESNVEILDRDLEVEHTVSVGGVPSRARVSPDGRLASVTTFVTGHSYATPGQFSTTTTLIDTTSGQVIADLEDFATYDDDDRVTARDVNYWGVTFAADGKTFYATMATGGRTHLIRGDIPSRRAQVIHDNVECPSLSPDGTRIGYKKLVATSEGAPKTWRFTVLDLATMKETALAEPAPRDDQLEWLDDDNILYQNGEEIWTVPADGSGQPARFAAAAGSPAVIR